MDELTKAFAKLSISPRKKNGRNRRRPRRNTFEQKVKKVMNKMAEKNFNDQQMIRNNVTDVLEQQSFTNIQAGTGNTDRIGNKIALRKFKVRYVLTLNNSSAFSLTRVFILQWLEDVQPANVPTVFQLMPTYEAAIRKYKVLYDETHQLSLGVNENLIRQFDISAKQFSPIEWSDSTGNSVISGNIEMYVISTNATTDAVDFLASTRLYWTDI